MRNQHSCIVNIIIIIIYIADDGDDGNDYIIQFLNDVNFKYTTAVYNYVPIPAYESILYEYTFALRKWVLAAI